MQVVLDTVASMKNLIAITALLLASIVGYGCTFCCEDCPPEEEPEPVPPTPCVRESPGNPGCITDTGVQCEGNIPTECPSDVAPGPNDGCVFAGRCMVDGQWANTSLYCCALSLPQIR